MKFIQHPFACAVSLVAFALALSACHDDSGAIHTFERTLEEAGVTCTDVCSDRMATDEVDDCIDIDNGAGEPAVACVLEPDYRVIERTIRLQTLHVEALGAQDCWTVCGQAIPGSDSDELVGCVDITTAHGEPAALCAIEWDLPKNNAF